MTHLLDGNPIPGIDRRVSPQGQTGARVANLTPPQIPPISI